MTRFFQNMMCLASFSGGAAAASLQESGWATSNGHACVECTYKTDTFAKCGKWSTGYIWCCTKTTNGAYINKADSASTVNGWAKCDVEATGSKPTVTTNTLQTYSLVGQGACVDGAGSHGSGNLAITRSSDGSAPHTNCQSWCNAQATCTGYDDRTAGCLYYKIVIADANAGAGQKCYKKGGTAGTSSSAPGPAAATQASPTPAPTTTIQASSSMVQYTGGYTCSDGYTKKLGEPLCTTAYNAGCSKATCCIAPKTCSQYSAAWIIKQGLNGGCQKNSNKAFFDTKKLAVAVASPHGDTEITSACCTPFSSAKCSDWAGVYGCVAGTSLQKDKSAAPDGTDGKSFSTVSKFREMCCITTPKQCSDYSALWIIAQAGNAGCQKDGNKAFFDTKKLAVAVASPQGDAEITSACCSPFSSAKCSDWAGVYGCVSGTSVQGDNSAAPDGADGKTFSSVDKFREKCCAAPSKSCSDYSVLWIAAQALGNGCSENSAKDFFDRKKLATTVASPQGEADIKAACCTPYSSAKCSDWAGVYGCAAGTVLLSTDSAAPDSADGKTFSTLAKFRQVCCKTPLKCSAYVGDEKVSGAIMHATSLWVAVVGMIAMWLL